MYKIECEVYGGVTGHRVAWMKHNGKELVFTTIEEARKHLPPNKTSAQGVRFNYRIVKIS